MTMVSRTGRLHSWTSCAVANPPTAANVAWHSEIWPAMPVITVIDRKITPKMTACVTMSSQKASSENIARPSVTTTSATPKARVAIVRPRPRAAELNPGGGGSTPASGSVASCCWRSPGQKSSSRNSSTNGSDGRSPVARTLLSGR